MVAYNNTPETIYNTIAGVQANICVRGYPIRVVKSKTYSKNSPVGVQE